MLCFPRSDFIIGHRFRFKFSDDNPNAERSGVLLEVIQFVKFVTGFLSFPFREPIWELIFEVRNLGLAPSLCVENSHPFPQIKQSAELMSLLHFQRTANVQNRLRAFDKFLPQ